MKTNMKTNKHEEELMLEPSRQEVLAEEISWNNWDVASKEKEPEWLLKLRFELKKIWSIKWMRNLPYIHGADTSSELYKNEVDKHRQYLKEKKEEMRQAEIAAENAKHKVMIDKCQTVEELNELFRKGGGLWEFDNSIHLFAERKKAIGFNK